MLSVWIKFKPEQSNDNRFSGDTFTSLLVYITTFKSSRSSEKLIVVLKEPGHFGKNFYFAAVHVIYTAVTSCILLIKLGIGYCITHFEQENRFEWYVTYLFRFV